MKFDWSKPMTHQETLLSWMSYCMGIATGIVGTLIWFVG
jgi:hypothetical protein